MTCNCSQPLASFCESSPSRLAMAGWPKDEKQFRKMAGLLPENVPAPKYLLPSDTWHKGRLMIWSGREIAAGVAGAEVLGEVFCIGQQCGAF